MRMVGSPAVGSLVILMTKRTADQMNIYYLSYINTGPRKINDTLQLDNKTHFPYMIVNFGAGEHISEGTYCYYLTIVLWCVYNTLG